MGDESAFLLEVDMYPPEANQAAFLQMVAGVHDFILIEPTQGGGLVTLKIVSSGLVTDHKKLGEFLMQVGMELQELDSES